MLPVSMYYVAISYSAAQNISQQKLVTNVTYNSTMNMILYKTNAKLNTLWQQKLSMI